MSGVIDDLPDGLLGGSTNMKFTLDDDVIEHWGCKIV